MSGEALEVTTARLRELAARHGKAATEVALATGAVSGVDSAIRTSHGVIARSTAGAVEEIQKARRDAGDRMAGESRALSEKLIAAASRYEAADGASSARLDQQILPGPTPPRHPR